MLTPWVSWNWWVGAQGAQGLVESFRACVSFVCHLVVILMEVLFPVDGGVLEMIKDSGGRSPFNGNAKSGSCDSLG